MTDGKPPSALVLGRCWYCGKLRYPKRRIAHRAGRKHHRGKRTRVYRCGDAWHVTTTKTPRFYYRNSRRYGDD